MGSLRWRRLLKNILLATVLAIALIAHPATSSPQRHPDKHSAFSCAGCRKRNSQGFTWPRTTSCFKTKASM